jgi:hypothetical protein
MADNGFAPSSIEQSNEYVAPVVRVMSESEVLSAFQVNAAGTMGWWVA